MKIELIKEIQKAAAKLSRKYASGEIARGFEPDGIYPYLDKESNLIYFRFRLKHPETSEKWIRPAYFNPEQNRFVLGEPKHKFITGKPLFNLPALYKNPSELVYFVEGEPCVDAFEKMGFLATTSGSATSARYADFTPLRNRRICIFRDNDEAGLIYAVEVTQKLLELNCNVSWIDVEKLGLPIGGDVIDLLKFNGGNLWKH